MKKSIFLFFAAILCVTSAWADVKGGEIYFDAYTSKWTSNLSTVEYVISHDSYSKWFKMANISNTQLYYISSESWGDAKYISFTANFGWNNSGEGNSYDHRKKYGPEGSWYTARSTYGVNSGSTYLFYAASASKDATIKTSSPAGYLGSGKTYTALNYTQTLKQELSTDNGASYAASTAALATVKVSSYKLKSKNATESSSGTIASGKSNTTCSAARTATVAYTVTNVESGYTFVGWYDGTTQKSTSTTYTYNATEAKTITARFSKEPKHTVTVSYKCGSTDVKLSETLEVGEVSAQTVTAEKIKDYTFSGWTLGTGVTSADKTANPISITTLSAGEYTLTANYTYIEPVIKTIYCKMEHNWWTQGDAAISAYASGTEGEMKSGLGTLMTLAPWESTVWKLDIDIARYQKVQFIRVSKDGLSDWNARTAVLDIPTDTKDLYTITQSTDMWYNGSYTCSGTWSTYTPAAVPDRYLTGNAAGFGMTIDGEGNEQWSPDAIKMTWNDATQKFTHTVSGLEANKYYKFRITDGTWTGKWGYSNLKSAIENVFEAEDNNISFVLAADGDLTITFDGTYIELTTTSSFAAPVYTIVGDAAVTGCHWDVNSVENQMVQDATNKNQFTLVKTVTAVAGEYEYKAIRNHSYDWQVASGTKLKIEKDGTGTITYTLDVSTKKLTAVVSDWVEGSVAQEVTLVGIGEDKEFTEAADHKTTSVAVELEANSVYTFEVVVNSVYMKNNGTMWRGNCTNWTFKSEENNAHIVTDLAGTYTFTWTYEGDKLSVTYPNGTNVPAPVFLGGDMNEWSWTKTRLIPSVDGKTASATINLTDVKTYNFKIKVGDTYLGNNGEMNREYHENWIFREKDGENDEKNAQITTDIIGNYTFTWTYETNALTVTYPEMVTEPESYTRTVTPGKFGTLCLPFGGTFEGAELFECVGQETGKVYIASVTELQAGVPYIFLATGTELAVYSDGTTAATPSVHNGLHGTFDNETVVAAGNYILLNNELRPSDGTAKVNANRAYLVMSEVQSGAPQQMPGRRYIGMAVEGENAETGFENIVAPEGETKKVLINGQLIIIRDGEMYNAQGVRF